MSGHTPGPWRARQRDWGYPDYQGGPEIRLWEIDAANGACIASCTIYASNGDGEADARLIAAAPDLLVALRWIMERNDAGMPMNNVCRDKARAAIAKTEGK